MTDLDIRAAREALVDVEAAFNQSRETLSLTDDSEPDPLILEVAENYSEPWNRLADEGNRSWELFKYYRDLGPGRTLAAVGEKFGIGADGIWSNHTRKFDWYERALGYDRYEDRIYNAQRATAIKDMAVRHADGIMEYLDALSVPFLALKAKIEQDPSVLEELSESSVKQLIDLSVKAGRIIPSMMAAERLARGMPSEIVEVKGEVTHTHELDRDQIGEVWATLHGAGAFAERGELGPGESPTEAEVVEVHSEDLADVRPEL